MYTIGKMAKNLSTIPGPIQKRDILYGVKKAPAEYLASLAKKFEDLGWHSDAADFLAHASDKAGLARLRAAAIEEGDTFLLFKIQRLLGEGEIPEDQLKKCALAAEQAGKIRHAIRAHERMQNAAEVARLRATISTDGDIVAEVESTVFIPEHSEEISDDEGN